jgi:hypothetical protein
MIGELLLANPKLPFSALIADPSKARLPRFLFSICRSRGMPPCVTISLSFSEMLPSDVLDSLVSFLISERRYFSIRS